MQEIVSDFSQKASKSFEPVSLLCMRISPGPSDTRVKLVVLWHRRLLTS